MNRILDLSALRAFLAIADTGGVTRAAGMLNLTQSAVSMQIKRLETALEVPLFDRVGRSLRLSTEGERLIGPARRMLAMNDKIFTAFAAPGFDEEIRLGVPYDLVPSFMPEVLKQFRASLPRSKLILHSSHTSSLKEDFAKGDYDMILTTERGCDPGGETLTQRKLIWVGASGGSAHQLRPLRLAFSRRCLFRPFATEALDEAGLDWEMAVEASSGRTSETVISADIAVGAMLAGTLPQGTAALSQASGLPPLGEIHINLYRTTTSQSPGQDHLARLLRQIKSAPRAPSNALQETA